MCESYGKAVRPNQWRVLRLLFEQDDLLPSLEKGSGQDVVNVHGDDATFPDGKSGPMELCAWLDQSTEKMRSYFDALLELYGTLAAGRNRKTTPRLQQRCGMNRTLRRSNVRNGSS